MLYPWNFDYMTGFSKWKTRPWKKVISRNTSIRILCRSYQQPMRNPHWPMPLQEDRYQFLRKGYFCLDKESTTAKTSIQPNGKFKRYLGQGNEEGLTMTALHPGNLISISFIAVGNQLSVAGLATHLLHVLYAPVLVLFKKRIT